MGTHFIQIKDSSGRLVIPKPIREALDIGSGALLQLTVNGNNPDKFTVEKVKVHAQS